MCFGLFKDSGCDFKRSELIYSFIQNLAGVIINSISIVYLSLACMTDRYIQGNLYEGGHL